MIQRSLPSDLFKQRLREAREMREWSQSDLGSKSDLPPSSIAHFEAGSRKPSFDTLQRLSRALEVSADYLLGHVDQPNVSQEGDPLFRDVGKLTGSDRELAKDFLKMLAERNQTKKESDDA